MANYVGVEVTQDDLPSGVIDTRPDGFTFNIYWPDIPTITASGNLSYLCETGSVVFPYPGILKAISVAGYYEVGVDPDWYVIPPELMMLTLYNGATAPRQNPGWTSYSKYRTGATGNDAVDNDLIRLSGNDNFKDLGIMGLIYTGIQGELLVSRLANADFAAGGLLYLGLMLRFDRA